MNSYKGPTPPSGLTELEKQLLKIIWESKDPDALLLFAVDTVEDVIRQDTQQGSLKAEGMAFGNNRKEVVV